MNQNQNKIRLLPNYFQKIAAVFFILSISSLFVLKGYFNVDDLAKQVALNGVLISFLIYMLAAQKIEDELTLELRMKSIAASFIAVITWAIVSPYVNFVAGDGFALNESVGEAIQFGIIFYFISYFILNGQEE